MPSLLSWPILLLVESIFYILVVIMSVFTLFYLLLILECEEQGLDFSPSLKKGYGKIFLFACIMASPLFVIFPRITIGGLDIQAT